MLALVLQAVCRTTGSCGLFPLLVLLLGVLSIPRALLAGLGLEERLQLWLGCQQVL